MKFLSVIAASLAAYASAQQQKPSFRGASNGATKNNRWQQKGTDTKRQRPQKNGSQNNKGQFQWPQKNGSQDNKGQFQWPQQKGGSKDNKGQRPQKGGSKDTKGRWPRQNNGGSKRGTEKCPPDIKEELLKQYSDEFHALDVDGNNVLDGKEFKEAGDKISDAFKSYRKGKKPSWYHKRPSRPSRGNNDQNSGKPSRNGRPSRGSNDQNSGRPSRNGRRGSNDQNSGRPSRNDKPSRGNTNDNNNNGGLRFGGNNRRLDDESQNFMKYLQQHGFGTPKKTQETKDNEDVKRAMQVFSKFDKDGNHKISLCEYENAMYRTQALEKAMKSRTNGYRGKNNRGRNNRGDKGDVVVVHG